MGKLGPCLTSLQAGLPSSCPCLGAEQPEVTSQQQPPGDGAPGPCSGAAGSGALTTADWELWLNPTGSLVQAPLEVEMSLGAGLVPGAEDIPHSMSRYPGGSGCQALFLMRWVVATLGTPASLSGFPSPPWAESNLRRWHDPHAWCLLWV